MADDSSKKDKITDKEELLNKIINKHTIMRRAGLHHRVESFVENIFKKHNVPIARMKGFDFLVKINNQEYAIEVKGSNNRNIPYLVTVTPKAHQICKLIAEKFGWKRILIVYFNPSTILVFEDISWIDSHIQKTRLNQHHINFSIKRRINLGVPIEEWIKKNS